MVKLLVLGASLLLAGAGCGPGMRAYRAPTDSGADVQYHSIESVLKTYQEARWELGRVHPNNPIVMAYLFAKKLPNRGPQEETAFKYLRKILAAGSKDDTPGSLSDIQRSTDYIRDYSWKIDSSAPCPGSKGIPQAASVNGSDRVAEVCVSTYSLSRMRTAHREDIMPILVRLLARLNGATEDESATVESFFKTQLPRLTREAALSVDYAKLIYLNSVWRNLLQYWPRIVQYTPFDRTSVLLAARFGIYLKNLEHDDSPAQFVRASAARPDLQESVHNRIFALSEDFKIYAEEIDIAIEAGRPEVTESHLLRMKRLTMGIIEIDELLTLYLFGDNPPPEGLLRFPRPSRIYERFWINKATLPVTLTDEAARPGLLCKRKVRDADEERERRKKVLELGEYSQDRCSEQWTDDETEKLMKLEKAKE